MNAFYVVRALRRSIRLRANIGRTAKTGFLLGAIEGIPCLEFLKISIELSGFNGAACSNMKNALLLLEVSERENGFSGNLNIQTASDSMSMQNPHC